MVSRTMGGMLPPPPPPAVSRLDASEFQPPPSSIAVIVQNLTKANDGSNGRPSEETTQLLQELHKEISEGGEELSDGILGFRLIPLVTAKGFVTLCGDDPFISHDVIETRMKQTSSTLVVIQITIKRTPQSLFGHYPDETGSQDDMVFLGLWLLPRLFGLLFHPLAQSMSGEVMATMESIFFAAAKDAQYWPHLKAMSQYCQSCLDVIWCSFNNVSTIKSVLSGSYELQLPAFNFNVEASLCKQMPCFNYQQVRFTIYEPENVAFLGVHLLMFFSRICTSGSKNPALRNVVDSLVPNQQGASKLWKRLDVWEKLPKLREKSESVRIAILEALSLLLVNASNETIPKPRGDGLYLFVLRCTLGMLHRPIVAKNQLLERAIAGIVLSVLENLDKSCLVKQFLENQILPPVLSIISDPNLWQLLSIDLVIILAQLVLYTGGNRYIEQVQTILDTVGGKWVCQDQRLANRLEALNILARNVPQNITRFPSKRPRLGVSSLSGPEEIAKSLVLKAYSILGTEATDIDGLSKVAEHSFVRLSEDKKCSFVKLLGLISCAAARNLSREVSGSKTVYECSYCDSNLPKITRNRNYATTHDSELFEVLEKTFKLVNFDYPPAVRCSAMDILKRLSNHTQDLRYLDIESSELGMWCLNGLNSSRRELRVAAGRALPSFLNFTHDPDIVAKNRSVILRYLNMLQTSKQLHLHETCILAWGQLGRLSTGQELNLILVQLVGYFGNASNFLVGVAFNELSEIAEAHELIPRKLISPFYRTISPDVVRQLKLKPQVIEHLARFMGISVPEFLALTRKYTIPLLILWKKDDVVKEIAKTLNKTVQTLCHENIPSILSVLFMQDWEDLEESAMSALIAISPHFSSSSIGELVRPDAPKLAAELLKISGDAEDEKEKEKAAKALILVSQHTYRKPQKREKTNENYLGLFFEAQVFGLCIIFSDNLKEPLGQTPMFEKVRCVKAIREMLLLVTKSITSALPQICTCLLSAMDLDALRTCAFDAWSALVANLSANDLTPLLGQTFSLILQYWDVFEDAAKNHAQEMIDQLFQNHLHPLKSSVASIPPLDSIPLFAKIDARLKNWRKELSITERLHHLSIRCLHENEIVVEQTLVELHSCLEENQEFFYTSATTEKVEQVIPEVIRCILDVIVSKGSTEQAKARIHQLCAKCLGLTGAMDPTLVETRRPQKNLVVLRNFSDEQESINFVIYLLEDILVQTFLSTKDTKAQGFLAWTMQELLQFCDLDQNTISITRRSSGLEPSASQKKWDKISPKAKEVLMPFLSSKYKLTSPPNTQQPDYPIFKCGVYYRDWIAMFLGNLLQKPHGKNASTIFEICYRICSRGSNAPISSFLLPYVVLHVAISGTNNDRKNIVVELLAVLNYEEQSKLPTKHDSLQKISESVFSIIDYMIKWIQCKREWIQGSKDRKGDNTDEVEFDIDIQRVEGILNTIPPDLMGKRSIELNSYARALLYMERHIRKTKKDLLVESEVEPLYEDLQRIYAHIDEPDGLEGISAKIPSLDIEQQVLEHRKAGRWTAAQSWYEMQLQHKPLDVDLQTNLITCLKDSGQYNALLSHVDGLISGSENFSSLLLTHAVETSWVVGKWEALDRYLSILNGRMDSNYDVCLGAALSALRRQDFQVFHESIENARSGVVATMTESNTNSLKQCHDHLVKLHGLTDLEGIIQNLHGKSKDISVFSKHLDTRLELMGTYSKDKQYILALRRAAFELSGGHETLKDIAVSAWLKTAKLARKDNQIMQAYNAIHHGTLLRPELISVEHAKLLWHEDQPKNAIRNLKQTLEKGILEFDNEEVPETSRNSRNSIQMNVKNIRVAKAKLLYAKWIDRTGRTQSGDILNNYVEASHWWRSWERGFYYIGRHYNKLLDAEKNLQPTKQGQPFITGDLTRHVVMNYLRAVAYGVKYIFQTMPRLLTLWMDLGEGIALPISEEYGTDEFRSHMIKERTKSLEALHVTTDRCIKKLGAWMFFTAFPQILSRIIHPHEQVYAQIQQIIIKVVKTYPQQSLWSLMAVIKSTNRERASRGARLLTQLKNHDRTLLNQAQKLTDQLLHLSNRDLPKEKPRLSLVKDIAFKTNVAPCSLVIPAQSILTVTLPSPAASELLHSHIAFPENQPTVHGFLDEVDIMTSLQKPRKITIRGSDGGLYHFLCKPKDDLRKDARLMEFNTMINRFLKKDPESRRRSLYIRTYSVTPLNEECGLIEWVNNVRTLRDIILRYLKVRGIIPSYAHIRKMLDESCRGRPLNTKLFTDELLPLYPPVFHEWFLDTFSEPATWFESRLRYTRTAAVMSMVGNILGLGDRHGENILLDQNTGDTLHVDFNCLFDKGLSFDKPERVPFRLTQNMVDAMGIAGYEGVFRKACESSMGLLRHNEETMMTVLETFIHDPAVDMVSRKKRAGKAVVPQDGPKEVLGRIQRRLRGLWEDESVPLSIEGQVESLIKRAVDPEMLCSMYIGWCPMF